MISSSFFELSSNRFAIHHLTDDRTGFDNALSHTRFRNITKCCTEVCPEHIHITDNAIIPLKERIVDRYYDPIAKLMGLFSEKRKCR